MSRPRLSARGLAAGAAAFTIWGALPLYLYPLRAVPATQVIAHRICWSCAFILGWMLLRRELGRVSSIFGHPRLLGGLAITALLISNNWLIYVWSVSHGHIVEASLGYYINPLVNVLLGVVVLRERLNRTQGVAIGLAAAAVLYLAIEAGRPPWIACALALSFSLYGLVRKTISVDALPGLATETLLLLPCALIYLGVCAVNGSGAFGRDGTAVTLLLVGSGLVTAVPLFLFAYGARALPYSTIGVLQYIGPSLQLIAGVLVFHERFGGARLGGFVLIWSALLLYALDGLRAARLGRPAAA